MSSIFYQELVQAVLLWEGDLVFGNGNVQEYVGGAHGVPQTEDWKDGQAAEGRVLEKRGRGKCNQRSY